MAGLIVVWRRRYIHEGQTSDTRTKFPSANAVFSGSATTLLFVSVAQLGALGKNLIAFGDKKHDPPSFCVGHGQGNEACVRFQPPPVFGISLNVGRICRHHALVPPTRRPNAQVGIVFHGKSIAERYDAASPWRGSPARSGRNLPANSAGGLGRVGCAGGPTWQPCPGHEVRPPIAEAFPPPSAEL